MCPSFCKIFNPFASGGNKEGLVGLMFKGNPLRASPPPLIVLTPPLKVKFFGVVNFFNIPKPLPAKKRVPKIAAVVAESSKTPVGSCKISASENLHLKLHLKK